MTIYIYIVHFQISSLLITHTYICRMREDKFSNVPDLRDLLNPPEGEEAAGTTPEAVNELFRLRFRLSTNEINLVQNPIHDYLDSADATLNTPPAPSVAAPGEDINDGPNDLLPRGNVAQQLQISVAPGTDKLSSYASLPNTSPLKVLAKICDAADGRSTTHVTQSGNQVGKSAPPGPSPSRDSRAIHPATSTAVVPVKSQLNPTAAAWFPRRQNEAPLPLPTNASRLESDLYDLSLGHRRSTSPRSTQASFASPEGPRLADVSASNSPKTFRNTVYENVSSDDDALVIDTSSIPASSASEPSSPVKQTVSSQTMTKEEKVLQLEHEDMAGYVPEKGVIDGDHIETGQHSGTIPKGKETNQLNVFTHNYFSQ